VGARASADLGRENRKVGDRNSRNPGNAGEAAVTRGARAVAQRPATPEEHGRSGVIGGSACRESLLGKPIKTAAKKIGTLPARKLM